MISVHWTMSLAFLRQKGTTGYMIASEEFLIRPEGNVKHLTAWIQWM